MALFMTGSGGATILFALPLFRKREFGGVFTMPIGEAPPPDAAPKEFPERRFWKVNFGSATISDPRQPEDYPLHSGLRASYTVCTHLGCLYGWTLENDRFECTCYGSKYLKTGCRVDIPAHRNLDVFVIESLGEIGQVMARTEPSMDSKEGTALQFPPGAVSLRVDTGRRILGAPNWRPGGGL